MKTQYRCNHVLFNVFIRAALVLPSLNSMCKSTGFWLVCACAGKPTRARPRLQHILSSLWMRSYSPKWRSECVPILYIVGLPNSSNSHRNISVSQEIHVACNIFASQPCLFLLFTLWFVSSCGCFPHTPSSAPSLKRCSSSSSPLDSLSSHAVLLSQPIVPNKNILLSTFLLNVNHSISMIPTVRPRVWSISHVK